MSAPWQPTRWESTQAGLHLAVWESDLSEFSWRVWGLLGGEAVEARSVTALPSEALARHAATVACAKLVRSLGVAVVRTSEPRLPR